jgi:hypothetical protein
MDDNRDTARREFLLGVKRWSGAVTALALGGVVATPSTASAWVNGTWANRAAGWVNRYGGASAWVNHHGGGSTAGWVNRGGGGSTAGWVNRYGGGGAAWVNR